MGGFLISLIRISEKKVLESHSWPRVKGEITDSDTTMCSSGFKLEVNYGYSVGSKQYVNNTLCIGVQDYDPFTRKKLRARQQIYSKGQIVDVFYNPDNPQNACLERETEGSLTTYLVGGAFIIVGAIKWLGLIFFPN